MAGFKVITEAFLGKRADLNPAWRFLVPVGFIGAYSTFSTYEWETLSTIRSGAFLLSAFYAVGSLVLGLAARLGRLFDCGDTLMRTQKQLIFYQSILDVLDEPGCPFCRFLKEYQAARLQNHQESIRRLCNFHAWGLAAVQNAPAAAQVFIKLVDEPAPISSDDALCDICKDVFAEEDRQIREFVGCIHRGVVSDCCEHPQFSASARDKTAGIRSNPWLPHESMSLLRTAAGSRHRSCEFCSIDRRQIGPDGDRLDVPLNFSSRNVDCIPEEDVC